MLHIKFQVPSSSSFLVLQSTKDEQTDGPKPICPLNFFKVGGGGGGHTAGLSLQATTKALPIGTHSTTAHRLYRQTIVELGLAVYPSSQMTVAFPVDR